MQVGNVDALVIFNRVWRKWKSAIIYPEFQAFRQQDFTSGVQYIYNFLIVEFQPESWRTLRLWFSYSSAAVLNMCLIWEVHELSVLSLMLSLSLPSYLDLEGIWITINSCIPLTQMILHRIQSSVIHIWDLVIVVVVVEMRMKQKCLHVYTYSEVMRSLAIRIK